MDAFEKWWASAVVTHEDGLINLPSHKEAFLAGKAEGIKEGMRRAAGIAKQQSDEHAKNLSMGKGTWPQSDYIRDEIWHQWEGQERASRWIANAILKEIGE